MGTLLLSGGPAAGTILSRRVRWADRVSVRLATGRLDARLAGGANPDSSAPLSMRAQALIGEPMRARLAHALRAALEQAVEHPRPLDPCARPCRARVLACRAELLELAQALLDPGPVEARGVARVAVLLSDGAGPLYGPGWSVEQLRAALRAALEALVPGADSRCC